MNRHTSEFQTDLFRMLNEHVEYAVLRNYEELPESNSSRDIDIAISRKDYKRIVPKLIELLEKQGWKLVTLLNSDRLATWVVGYIDDTPVTELIQLDFFFNTSVFGVELLSTKDLIAGRRYNGKIYIPSKEIEFLDKYLYDRAVGAPYPEKYRATRDAVKDSPIVNEKIKQVFGCDNLAECDRASGRTLMISAGCRSLARRPLVLVAGVGRFLHSFIGNYLMSRTGFSIGFTGPDGSGKTTVINRTIERLGDVFKTAHAYLHFRPALFGNIGDVAHSAGLKKEVDRNYSDPHRGGKTGVLSSIARLGYYSVDYILGYFVKVKSYTRLTRLVVFDRYFTDIICDSRRSRIYLPPKFLNFWRRLFIPSLDYNILLTASPETILSRKQELDAGDILSINDRIDYLAHQRGYLKILNESTPDNAVTIILTNIFTNQHRKNIARLKK